MFSDSCKKKKECKPPKVQLIEQEMIDWLFYKPGSYWIYIDSVTGAYDSIYVTKTYYDTLNFLHSDLFRNSNNNCTIKSHQVIVIEYESLQGLRYTVGGTYGFGNGIQNNTNPVNGTSQIENLNHNGGDGGYSHYMYFPVLQGTKGAWNGYTIIEHDTIYKQYELKGNKYENVLRVSDGLNGAYNAITKFYHCKHIGVIKKEIYRFKDFNDREEPELLHVWELVRYEVKQ
jgi:hypothetical protein